MSEVYTISAPAKTNLWLRILGKREDGYHEIDTRMVLLDLADELRLSWRDDGEIVLRCSDPALPIGEDNLVIKAVRALEAYRSTRYGLTIDLNKVIPSGAGLGGGSSDAAAVLRALNEMASLQLREDTLAEIGAGFGSDIPFFLYDRACDCRGRGEIVQPLSADEAPPAIPLFLVKPDFGTPAAWAYQHYSRSSEHEGFHYAPQPMPWGSLANDLERPVFEKFPLLGDMKTWLLAQSGVCGALLSGSGSTVLAVLEDLSFASSLQAKTLARYGENCWTWSGLTK